MQNIIEAAQEKFGEVIAIIKKNNDKEYKLVIERNGAPLESRPFMTISAIQHRGENPSFYFGHYDMTREEALAEVYSVLPTKSVKLGRDRDAQLEMRM